MNPPISPSEEPLAPHPWTRVTAGTDAITYERTVESDRRGTLLQLHACRSSESYPPGSGSTGWKLQLTKRLNGRSVPQSTTHVSVRPEAVQALFGAMRRVNSALRSEGGGSAPDTGLAEPFGGGMDHRGPS